MIETRRPTRSAVVDKTPVVVVEWTRFHTDVDNAMRYDRMEKYCKISSWRGESSRGRGGTSGPPPAPPFCFFGFPGRMGGVGREDDEHDSSIGCARHCSASASSLSSNANNRERSPSSWRASMEEKGAEAAQEGAHHGGGQDESTALRTMDAKESIPLLLVPLPRGEEKMGVEEEEEATGQAPCGAVKHPCIAPRLTGCIKCPDGGSEPETKEDWEAAAAAVKNDVTEGRIVASHGACRNATEKREEEEGGGGDGGEEEDALEERRENPKMPVTNTSVQPHPFFPFESPPSSSSSSVSSSSVLRAFRFFFPSFGAVSFPEASGAVPPVGHAVNVFALRFSFWEDGCVSSSSCGGDDGGVGRCCCKAPAGCLSDVGENGEGTTMEEEGQGVSSAPVRGSIPTGAAIVSAAGPLGMGAEGGTEVLLPPPRVATEASNTSMRSHGEPSRSSLVPS